MVDLPEGLFQRKHGPKYPSSPTWSKLEPRFCLTSLISLRVERSSLVESFKVTLHIWRVITEPSEPHDACQEDRDWDESFHDSVQVSEGFCHKRWKKKCKMCKNNKTSTNFFQVSLQEIRAQIVIIRRQQQQQLQVVLWTQTSTLNLVPSSFIWRPHF